MTFLETKNWKLETSSGSYLSTNLLLVSDEEDRVGLGLPPDARLAMSNRTFKVSLGDNLVASYGDFLPLPGFLAAETTTTVGRNIRNIHLNLAVMTTNNGVACIDNFQRLTNDVVATRERYAQMDITVTHSVTFFEAPAWFYTFPLENWPIDTWTNGMAEVTQYGREIIEAARGSNPGIWCVYMPRVFTAMGFVNGTAITKKTYTNSINQAYVDTCFISVRPTPGIGSALSPLVLPHEVVHLLGHSGHVSQYWNLMFTYLSTTNNANSTKRLTKEQIINIQKGEHFQ